MSFKFIAFIETDGNGGYIAWIDKVKGVIVQGDSEKEALNELFVSMKVKISHEWNVPFDKIVASEISHDDYKSLEKPRKLQKRELQYEVA